MVMTAMAREVNDLIGDLPTERLYVLEALHRVHHRYGYIPQAAMPVVAAHFGMATATLFGVVSFYAEFRLAPPPETLVMWCSGPACRLKGGDRIRQVFEHELGIRMEEKTANSRAGLHLGQCNGTCDHAPQVWVNGKVRGPLTIADAIRLAHEIRDGQGESGAGG
jgi:NADH:ubiquinone oxidoreductase subunit E